MTTSQLYRHKQYAMPVYSMTGYASAQHSLVASDAEGGGKPVVAGCLGLEIRSVNSRFLDLSLRLSDELRAHEPALRELVAGRLKRGKVEVRAFVEQGSTSGAGDPSPRLLQRLNALQDSVRAWLPLAALLSVADVLRFASQEQSARHDWGPHLIPLAEKVADDLLRARQREGARLGDTILERVSQLREFVAQASPLVPQLVAQQKQRFIERWAQAMASGEGSATLESAQDRALAEATAFAIRIDVAEEISRLGSHLDEIERLVKKGGEIGKRLDFLMQELHREANTLGSKSAALELTHISVNMKVLIEQMREQVQNIE